MYYSNMTESLSVNPGLRLGAAPTKRPGFLWALPIDVRLDELVALANREGANTSRQELLSALVLTAPAEGRDLFEHVVKLRRATVEDALLGQSASELPLHGPGRRTATSTLSGGSR